MDKNCLTVKETVLHHQVCFGSVKTTSNYLLRAQADVEITSGVLSALFLRKR